MRRIADPQAASCLAPLCIHNHVNSPLLRVHVQARRPPSLSTASSSVRSAAARSTSTPQLPWTAGIGEIYRSEPSLHQAVAFHGCDFLQLCCSGMVRCTLLGAAHLSANSAYMGLTLSSGCVCVARSYCDDCWRMHFRAMIGEGKARDLRWGCLGSGGGGGGARCG